MLTPNWPAPKNIKAITLTKEDSLTNYPHIKLLHQVHESTIIELPDDEETLHADGAYTHQPHIPCAIKTADCLAILLCNQAGTEVAALHGGWRGLAKGIIANGLAEFTSPPEELMAWLSPAICQNHYEVDQVVYDAFCNQEAIVAWIERSDNPGRQSLDYRFAQSRLQNCFIQNRPGHWLMSLTQIARMQLAQCGVTQVFGGEYCTFENKECFYSYRREPTNPGRLVHVIWRE